jgi:predicted CXXCH cytochrome family protein
MLECTSCHSVHNTGNTGERLLWRSDVRSQLCLSCHDKGEDPGAATP